MYIKSLDAKRVHVDYSHAPAEIGKKNKDPNAAQFKEGLN
jgi:hypothetical protein